MLPVLAMIALWWNGWPGSSLSRLMGGLVNTAILVVAVVVLTFVGSAIVGHAALPHILGLAGAGDVGLPTFPFTMPLAATVFVVFLQLTFVHRKWPFDRMGPMSGGLAALATAWIVGLAVYELLTNWSTIASTIPADTLTNALGLRVGGGPFDALQFVDFLLCVVVVQMLGFMILEGHPLSRLSSTRGNLAAATALTLGLGYVLFRVIPAVGLNIGAVAGTIVAGSLSAGLLLEAWPASLGASRARWFLLLEALALGLLFYVVLYAIAGTEEFFTAPADLWVSIAGLNFIAAPIIVHVVLWRRWPIPVADLP
jgi:hypothetical protein